MSKIQEPIINQQSTSKELEVYIRVYPQMAINKYTFKASIVENSKEQEIYSYSPKDDPPTDSPFKQLTQSFPVTMKWQTKQSLIIQVLERESKKLFGKVENLKVGELFGSRREGVKKPLISGQHVLGTIFVHFQDKQSKNEIVKLQIITQEVQIGGCLCLWRNSYYFTITRKLLDNNHIVYESPSTKSPSEAFPPIQISTRKLCANKLNQDLTINIRNTSDHRLIGRSTFSLSQLNSKEIFKIEDEKELLKGRLIPKCEKKGIKHEFTEYLKNGMQMALVIGIDFTASNLPFANQESLHYFNETTKSLYEMAISEVGEILLQFDYDKKVAVYGFGAKIDFKDINSGTNTYHCFPVSGLNEEHELVGLQGILHAYRQILPHLTFSGPTYFAPIIKQAIEVCRNMKKQGREYMILLLLTDGEICDYDDVVNLIVQCGRLPISIIIVGITNDKKEEWPLMKKLDDNNMQLKDTFGRKTQRDLVKFVEFNNCYQTPGMLAKEVLSELPKQVEYYHTLQGIAPSAYNIHLPKDDRLIAQKQDEADKKTFHDSYCMIGKGKQNHSNIQEEEKIQSSFGTQKRLNEFKKENQKEKKKEKEGVDASMINISLDNMMQSRPRSPKGGKKYTPDG